MGDILLGVSLVAMLVSVVASLIAVRLLRQVERIAALAEHPLYSIDPDHRWPGEIGGTVMTTWPDVA